ncbi:9141_t:CDS:1, partial [Cetraspora pellucida]
DTTKFNKKFFDYYCSGEDLCIVIIAVELNYHQTRSLHCYCSCGACCCLPLLFILLNQVPNCRDRRNNRASPLTKQAITKRNPFD